MKQENADLSLW